jgi:CheY-like chemotaxis protein
MTRVLIADDNAEIRTLVGRVLERDGHDVEAVGDGRKAIAKIETERYDAILLDFMMPGATGFDVINWIVQNRPEVAKSCVIILTAAVQELQKFDTSKVYAAVAKPFDVGELREIVRKCIEKKTGRGAAS